MMIPLLNNNNNNNNNNRTRIETQACAGHFSVTLLARLTALIPVEKLVSTPARSATPVVSTTLVLHMVKSPFK